MVIRHLVDTDSEHNQSLELIRLLDISEKRKANSEIYVARPDGQRKTTSLPGAELMPPPDDSDVLVYHFNGSSSPATDFLAGRSERVVLVAHQLCDAARGDGASDSELQVLRTCVSTAIAFTPSQKEILQTNRFDDVYEVAFAHDPRRLSSEKDDLEFRENVLRLFPDGFILCVNDFVPASRIELLVGAVHLLRTVHRSNIGIVVLSGNEDSEYRAAVDQFKKNYLGVNTLFLGPVSESGLATLYRSARAYVDVTTRASYPVRALEAMSEGCPALVVKLKADWPVVYGAAVLLDQDAGPVLVAEALARILRDEPLRKELTNASTELGDWISEKCQSSGIADLVSKFIR